MDCAVPLYGLRRFVGSTPRLLYGLRRRYTDYAAPLLYVLRRGCYTDCAVATWTTQLLYGLRARYMDYAVAISTYAFAAILGIIRSRARARRPREHANV